MFGVCYNVTTLQKPIYKLMFWCHSSIEFLKKGSMKSNSKNYLLYFIDHNNGQFEDAEWEHKNSNIQPHASYFFVSKTS